MCSLKKDNVPQLRFSQFDDEWVENKLSDVASFSKGSLLSKSDLTDEGHPCVLYGELYTKYNEVISNVISRTKFHKENLVVGFKNDVLIPSSGETAFDIACASALEVDGVFLGGDLNIIRPKNSISASFLSYQLNTARKKELVRVAQGATVVHLYHSGLKDVSVFLPKLEEQRKIALFFNLLNQKIEKQQEKIEQLELFRKGMIQKIFSREIRLKDEYGRDFPEWGKKPLKEIVDRITRKNSDLESTLPLTISAQHGLVDQVTFFNKTVASKNLTGYYLLYKGEFAYNKSYSNGYPLGAIKRLDKYEKGVLSSLYICFTPKESISGDYLTHYFESTFWHKEIAMISVEGARNHGLLNISVSDFFETIHLVPSLEEQNRIAEFLNTIGKKLNKEKGKLEELKQQKKGFLQQMFV